MTHFAEHGTKKQKPLSRQALATHKIVKRISDIEYACALLYGSIYWMNKKKNLAFWDKALTEHSHHCLWRQAIAIPPISESQLFHESRDRLNNPSYLLRNHNCDGLTDREWWANLIFDGKAVECDRLIEVAAIGEILVAISYFVMGWLVPQYRAIAHEIAKEEWEHADWENFNWRLLPRVLIGFLGGVFYIASAK